MFLKPIEHVLANPFDRLVNCCPNDSGNSRRKWWWNCIRDLRDLVTQCSPQFVRFRKALQQHCLEDAEPSFSVRMDMYLSISVGDGPTRLVPFQFFERPSVESSTSRKLF